MVNFGLNSASILGIFLAVAGAGLYFLRSVRPELSRDHDIFFAAVGLLCGLILLFQGWRLDPILQFGQFLLTGSAVFFAVETIRLRGVATEQARRNSPIVEDRPVSNVYRAELESLEPYEEEDYEPRGRLRGYADSRSSRSSGYEEQAPRTPRSRRSSDSYGSREAARQRQTRPSSPSAYQPYDEWSEPASSWEETPPAPTRPRRPRPEVDTPPATTARTPKKRRPRPPQEPPLSSRELKSNASEYVDYQPIDEVEQDKSEWEQQPPPERSAKDDYNEDNPVRFDY
jgi:hypothetical protein